EDGIRDFHVTGVQTCALPILGPHEVDYLFGLVEDVRAGGAGVLYISHRLEEVVRIADRVSVLRDGRLVWTGPTAETSREQIVRQDRKSVVEGKRGDGG